MNKILFLLIIAVFLFGPVGVVFAQYNAGCPNVYGAGCPTGTLTINKTVKNPTTGEWVDTLSSNGPNFLPGQEVDFRVEVKNTGNTDLTNVNVVDKFPDFLNFVSGGNFDSKSKTISWNIDRLKPNESRIFDIKAKLADSKSIPDMGITCLTNFAQAQANGQQAQDTSVFCLQTKVLSGTTQLPQTGPEETTILLVSSVSLLILSSILRRNLKNLKGGEEID